MKIEVVKGELLKELSQYDACVNIPHRQMLRCDLTWSRSFDTQSTQAPFYTPNMWLNPTGTILLHFRSISWRLLNITSSVAFLRRHAVTFIKDKNTGSDGSKLLLHRSLLVIISVLMVTFVLLQPVPFHHLFLDSHLQWFIYHKVREWESRPAGGRGNFSTHTSV